MTAAVEVTKLQCMAVFKDLEEIVVGGHSCLLRQPTMEHQDGRYSPWTGTKYCGRVSSSIRR